MASCTGRMSSSGMTPAQSEAGEPPAVDVSVGVTNRASAAATAPPAIAATVTPSAPPPAAATATPSPRCRHCDSLRASPRCRHCASRGRRFQIKRRRHLCVLVREPRQGRYNMMHRRLITSPPSRHNPIPPPQGFAVPPPLKYLPPVALTSLDPAISSLVPSMGKGGDS
ncbi:unnamed protein product [Urochloa humidicola]